MLEGNMGNEQVVLYDIPLPVRLATVLWLQLGIKTLGQVAALTDDQFLRLPKIGRQSYEDMRAILQHYGLDFTEGEPEYGSCSRCGDGFIQSHGRQKYCSPCRRLVSLDCQRQSRQKRRL